jgi:c-di-AMP phosphodiesterase-like protein
VVADPGGRDDSAGTIRVNVRLVNVFATVTDAHGAPVAGLQKDDFKVLEDGVEQSIRVFDKESEMPLSIVMGIDTSESTRRDLKLETASAKRFAQSIVRPRDRLAILQITENVDQFTRLPQTCGSSSTPSTGLKWARAPRFTTRFIWALKCSSTAREERSWC